MKTNVFMAAIALSLIVGSGSAYAAHKALPPAQQAAQVVDPAGSSASDTQADPRCADVPGSVLVTIGKVQQCVLVVTDPAQISQVTDDQGNHPAVSADTATADPKCVGKKNGDTYVKHVKGPQGQDGVMTMTCVIN